jgi:phage tail sheath gpL-like
MARDVTLTKASGVLTATTNFSDADTVFVGGTTYRYKTTPAQANDIDVGSTLTISLTNLAAAINGTGSSGATTYYAGTATVSCLEAVSTSTTLTVTARFGGAWGNAIQLREGVDGGTAFSISTAMSNGAGDVEDFISGILSLNQVNAEVQEALYYMLNVPVGS